MVDAAVSVVVYVMVRKVAVSEHTTEVGNIDFRLRNPRYWSAAAVTIAAAFRFCGE